MPRTRIGILPEDAHQTMMEGMTLWFKQDKFTPGSLRELAAQDMFWSFADMAVEKDPIQRTPTENYLVGLLISIAQMQMNNEHLINSNGAHLAHTG